MVDVVRRGENIIKCNTCDSVLRYSSMDIKTREVTDWKSIRGEKVSIRIIECPVCYEDVFLNRTDLQEPVGTATKPENPKTYTYNPRSGAKGHKCNSNCDQRVCDPDYLNRAQ